MKFKTGKLNYVNLIILIALFLLANFLYRRYVDKLKLNDLESDTNMIQKYLLSKTDKNSNNILEDNKKPILWIPIEYQYNARNWISFGSRSSYDLNQPYLYLTVKSIIQHCKDSFHVCLVDDDSFSKLIPGWNINMSSVSYPISNKFRDLAMTKLLYLYGGIVVPPSFLCMKNLIGMYQRGTTGNKMFVCETINRTGTSVDYTYYPDISFMGSVKENPDVKGLLEFMERTISTDFTSESIFLGKFNKWCALKIQKNEVNLIPAIEIGVKDINDDPITIEILMSQGYISLYSNAYGILIPAYEILNRTNYEWFARLSPEQVLKSDTIIGKYILLANAPYKKDFAVEGFEEMGCTGNNNRSQQKECSTWWYSPLMNGEGIYCIPPLGGGLFVDRIPKKNYPDF
jgi:hypothetical protein